MSAPFINFTLTFLIIEIGAPGTHGSCVAHRADGAHRTHDAQGTHRAHGVDRAHMAYGDHKAHRAHMGSWGFIGPTG